LRLKFLLDSMTGLTFVFSGDKTVIKGRKEATTVCVGGRGAGAISKLHCWIASFLFELIQSGFKAGSGYCLACQPGGGG
jgi:hypothetical protein